MKWKIPLFKIYTDESDERAVSEVIKSGMNWATGQKIAEFEDLTAKYIGSEYAVTFNSGTSALRAVLTAYDIGPGDEVIVPSFTFIATANAPLFVGAKPVFADIEEKTLGLDPEDVIRKITPKTKAMIPIHYGGTPCRIRELREIAEDNDLVLIEDAAESFGAKIGNEMTGSFGDSALLSFCQNKIITTGEGGAIVTSSKEIQNRLKLIRSHGRVETCDYFSSTDNFEYVSLGYNLRMSNITAALGIAQIRKADYIIDLRRKKAEYYKKNIIKNIRGITFCNPPEDHFNVFQLFSLRVSERNRLMTFLAKDGIMSKIYFSPVHLTSFYRTTMNYDCRLSVTEQVSEDILSLPFYPGITTEEIDCVVNSIRNFYEMS